MRAASPSLLRIGDRVAHERTISPRPASSPRNSRYNIKGTASPPLRQTVNMLGIPTKSRSKPKNMSGGPKRETICCPLTAVCSDLCDKLSDHLLLGQFSHKVFAEPLQNVENTEEPNDSEKKEIVLADPKFGMFSLFLWHTMRKPLRSSQLFCSDVFSLTLALPILLFITQWILYIALVSHEVNRFDGDFCPNKGTFENKMMMLGIGLIYFIRSFFIWDSLTVQNIKMNRMDNISAIMDTFQEFLFNILVYTANLWLIFGEDDIQNMIMNSLAMEFLMRADNEFEEFYFSNVPEASLEIYDTMYVNKKENQRLVSKKRDQSFVYNSVSCVLVLLYKLLVIVIFLFPIFCAVVTIGGAICK
jgi:hypothetical protein